MLSGAKSYLVVTTNGVYAFDDVQGMPNAECGMWRRKAWTIGTLQTGYVPGLGRRRLEQRDNTTATWFRWSGGEECGEYAGTVGSWTIGALQTGYLPGLAAFAGSNPATAAWRYHLTDHLGSVRQMSCQTKAALARYDYAPYGELMRNAGLPLTVGYTGHLWDSAIGQYYAPFRYYNPQTARWNMRDPLGFVDGPNMYAYVAGNPVNEYDPLGLSTAAGVCMIAIGPSLPSLSSMVSALVVGAGSIGVFLTSLPVSVPVIVAGVLVGATAGAIIGINIYAKKYKASGQEKGNDLTDQDKDHLADNPRKPGESGNEYVKRTNVPGRGPRSMANRIRKYIDRKNKLCK